MCKKVFVLKANGDYLGFDKEEPVEELEMAKIHQGTKPESIGRQLNRLIKKFGYSINDLEVETITLSPSRLKPTDVVKHLKEFEAGEAERGRKIIENLTIARQKRAELTAVHKAEREAEKIAQPPLVALLKEKKRKAVKASRKRKSRKAKLEKLAVKLVAA